MNKYAIVVMRCSPPHKGHQKVIQKMIDDCGVENCLLLIGSSNAPLSWRVLFPYYKRRAWIKRLFKDLKVIGIPDTIDANDSEWFDMLDDYISAVFPDADNSNITFYGGSRDDVSWFYTHGKRHVEIVNRETYPISATKVRQMLLNGMSIDEVVDKRIVKEVVEAFNSNLEKLDKLRG